MNKIKRVKREVAYEGNIITMYNDYMVNDNGEKAKWDFIDHPGAAAVVAVTDEGKLLMVRQYRNSIDGMTLELPAGKLDYAGEDMMECAARELREETGYVAEKMEWLINIHSWIAFTNELIGVYVATNLKAAIQKLDDFEYIDVEEYTVDELKSMIFNREITDGKTIAGILAYASKYSK